jgi:hypothetical protein
LREKDCSESIERKISLRFLNLPNESDLHLGIRA